MQGDRAAIEVPRLGPPLAAMPAAEDGLREVEAVIGPTLDAGNRVDPLTVAAILVGVQGLGPLVGGQRLGQRSVDR